MENYKKMYIGSTISCRL